MPVSRTLVGCPCPPGPLLTMRRVALYSDIHGNRMALEAVYRDIAERGLTERYCLGDLVGYGPDPVGVMELVRATGDRVVQGNYDRGVGGRLGDCGCYYATPKAEEDVAHLRLHGRLWELGRRGLAGSSGSSIRARWRRFFYATASPAGERDL